MEPFIKEEKHVGYLIKLGGISIALNFAVNSSPTGIFKVDFTTNISIIRYMRKKRVLFLT